MTKTTKKPNISNIVSLSGFIGSGKSTVAKIFVEHGYTEIAFADKLKDVVSIVFGWDRNLLEGDSLESRNFRNTVDPYWSSKFSEDITPRKIFQKVGTEAFRKYIHEDIWVLAVFNEIEKNPDKKYVISDARFKNELSYIEKYNGSKIRVKRGPDPDWYDIAYDTNTINPHRYLEMMERKIHISEWDWIGTSFDYELNNNGSVDDLVVKIENFLRN